jgi:hypothetical protein
MDRTLQFSSKRIFIALLLMIFSSLSAGAGQIFVPLDKDFVWYDLQSKQIVASLGYDQAPLGLGLSLSSDGRSLYYVKRLQGNTHLYQKDLQSGREQALPMPQLFDRFRLVNDQRVVLDDRHPVDLPHATSALLPKLYLSVIALQENSPKAFFYQDDRYTLPSSTGEIVAAYYLHQEDLFLLNLLFVQATSWQSYYQWYLFDAKRSQLILLPSLRGAANANLGGAFGGARPQVWYVHSKSERLTSANG